ncbi:hypothetical protein E4T39_02312 [Aureobasidium subglaciale]|nr:hypothetical protein E4T39_02312 [Aureobasidium subglaciale]
MEMSSTKKPSRRQWTHCLFEFTGAPPSSHMTVCILVNTHLSKKIIKLFTMEQKRWTTRGSNPRPSACKADALPLLLWDYGIVERLAARRPIGC